MDRSIRSLRQRLDQAKFQSHAEILHDWIFSQLALDEGTVGRWLDEQRWLRERWVVLEDAASSVWPSQVVEFERTLAEQAERGTQADFVMTVDSLSDLDTSDLEEYIITGGMPAGMSVDSLPADTVNANSVDAIGAEVMSGPEQI